MSRAAARPTGRKTDAEAGKPLPNLPTSRLAVNGLKHLSRESRA